jgi:hypothetical protein
MTHILGGTIVTFLMIRYVRDGKESLRSVLEAAVAAPRPRHRRTLDLAAQR